MNWGMKSERFSHNPQAATSAYQRKGVFYFWRLYHCSHNAPGGFCLIAFVGTVTRTSLHLLPRWWPHQKPQLGVEWLPQPLTHSPCTPSRHQHAQRYAQAPRPHPVNVPPTAPQNWRGRVENIRPSSLLLLRKSWSRGDLPMLPSDSMVEPGCLRGPGRGGGVTNLVQKHCFAPRSWWSSLFACVSSQVKTLHPASSERCVCT